MQTEIEAKFLGVDLADIRARLQAAGAKCEQPMRLMRRVAFDVDGDSYVRVRDEGHKVTMTYKHFSELSLTGVKELEVAVDNFETAVAILKAIGINAGSFQESRRETWQLGDIEVVIDEWPWLDQPYIEIEGPTEDGVRQAAQTLGFRWNDAVFGDVMAAYRAQYPHLTPSQTIARMAEVRFGDPLPDLLKS